MLKTRIITALVILPILLLALFTFPAWAWDLFTLVVVLIGCWEWSRFCEFKSGGKRLFVGLSVVIGLSIFVANYFQRTLPFDNLATASFIISALFWVVIAPLWLLNTWRPKSAILRGLVGWIVIFPTWLAFLALHDAGPWILLSFAIIVWVADVSAYFFGKTFGKHKLAIKISPGKTIEGALGGLLGVVIYFFIWQHFSGNSFFAELGVKASWIGLLRAHGYEILVLFLVLGVLSIIGDLFESWMKRGVGLKDSGNLLPGHGGIMDRIDALTSTLPIAALYFVLTTPHS
jgi:phosphatidate cytidylyltransferase